MIMFYSLLTVMQVTTPNSELRTAFETKMVREQCQSKFTNPRPNTLDQQQCEAINMCNWAFCNDAANPQCTAENCADPVIKTDEFCQVCFGPSSCYVVRY